MTTVEEDSPEGKSFDLQFKKYVENFLATPSRELDTFKKGGLLKPENRNIVEHLLKARALTEVLCDLFEVKGKAKDDVVSAATIHDAFVLKEKKYIRRKTKQETGTNYKDLQFVKGRIAERYKKLGFSEEVIKLTDENITHEEDGPKETTAKIFFLVDAMLSGPEIVDVPKRFDLTRRGWRSDLKKFDEETAKGNIKYWREFFKGAPGHGDRPHDEVQLETSARICREFSELLKKKYEDTKYDNIFGENGDPNMLPYYIEDRLKEKITDL